MPYPVEWLVSPLTCLLLVACTATGEQGERHGTSSDRASDSVDRRQSPQAPEAIVEAARALVAAAPASWSAKHRNFVRCQGEHSRALLDALQADPHGPGVQISLATLGDLGDPAAVSFLESQLRDGSTVQSSESALALGKLPSPSSKTALLAEMNHRRRDPLVRCSAAAALLDLGAIAESMPFLCAIILAGTPRGQAMQENLGLPDRGRWAHERYLAIEAIKRQLPQQDFGLDPDSSWPALEAAVDRLVEFLRVERGLDLQLGKRAGR